MLKYVAVISTSLLLASVGPLAQSRDSLSTDAALEQQVVEAEHAWAAAFQNCQTDAIDALMTPDFTMTGFNGITYSRQWFMNVVEDCTHDVIRIEPLSVRVYGDSTAIVISKFHQFINENPAPLFDLTHVLVRGDGTWQVALHHSTTINETAGPTDGQLFPGLAGGPSTKE
jgi:ketosteroid isomerase-like protein